MAIFFCHAQPKLLAYAQGNFPIRKLKFPIHLILYYKEHETKDDFTLEVEICPLLARTKEKRVMPFWVKIKPPVRLPGVAEFF